MSQGFDGVEWPATAMKLKLGGEGKSPVKKGRSDPEGLAFLTLSFSPAYTPNFGAALADDQTLGSFGVLGE